MLVLMVIPSFGNMADQARSGYIPPDYWLLPLLILVSIALSAAVVVGLIRWLRGSRRTLICVDIAVLVMSWSFLLVFVLSNDLPVVDVVLAPVAAGVVCVKEGKSGQGERDSPATNDLQTTMRFAEPPEPDDSLENRMTPKRSRAHAARATGREVGVVAAVLAAGSEKAAAHQLGLSHSTVKHHPGECAV